MKFTATHKLQTLCQPEGRCNCPTITDDKACAIVALINTFVTDSNPIVVEMSDKDYREFLLYVTIASLREGR